MHSSLLEALISELKAMPSQQPVLDLACGGGRNGLFCLKNDIPVIFADIKEQALSDIQQVINNDKKTFDIHSSSFWQVDLEQDDVVPFFENSYRSILVFRYLHRPLFEQLKSAIMPNGLIVYETFTEQQANIGRPKNPDFLLKNGELAGYFSGWEILHSFEGVIKSDTGENQQAVAQIIARKPY